MFPFLQCYDPLMPLNVMHNMQKHHHNHHAKLLHEFQFHIQPKIRQKLVNHKNIRPAEYPRKNSIGWPNGRKNLAGGSVLCDGREHSFTLQVRHQKMSSWSRSSKVWMMLTILTRKWSTSRYVSFTPYTLSYKYLKCNNEHYWLLWQKLPDIVWL